MNLAAFAFLSVGLLTFLLSLPLVFRKVPMNPFYGIRIPAAFESNERWYEINAYGGRHLAIWSWLPIIAGVAGLFVAPDQVRLYALWALPITLLGLLIPLLLVLLRAPRGPATPSSAARLHELEQLRAQRLISEAEYAAKRKEILDRL